MKLATFFKGVLYGIFGLLPGLSGTFVAICFGDYQRIIRILFDKKIFDNIKYLLTLGCGLFIGVTVTAKFLLYLYANFYIFFRIIIVAINIFILLLRFFKMKYNVMFVLKIFLFSILFISIFRFINFDVKYDFWIVYIVPGFLYSFSKIVPGVSTTAILMKISFYDELMYFLSSPFKCFANGYISWLIFLLSFFFFSVVLLKFIGKLMNTKYFDFVISLLMVVNVLISL